MCLTATHFNMPDSSAFFPTSLMSQAVGDGSQRASMAWFLAVEQSSSLALVPDHPTGCHPVELFGISLLTLKQLRLVASCVSLPPLAPCHRIHIYSSLLKDRAVVFRCHCWDPTSLRTERWSQEEYKKLLFLRSSL